MTFDEQLEHWAEHLRRHQAAALATCRHLLKMRWQHACPDAAPITAWQCLNCGTFFPELPEVHPPTEEEKCN